MKKKIIVGIFILLAMILGGSGVATAKIKEGKQNEDILERNENVTTASDVEYGYANSILKYKQYCRLIEGTGEIDWTIAIYEALKEGTVFFPEGTYYISNDIVLTQEGVGLYGVGPKSVIRACAGAKFNEAMMCIRNSFVEIKNMRICGRSEEKKVNTHIIKTGSRVDTGAKTNYVKLLNVMVNYSERTGVCVDDAYDVIIDGCYSSFNNCGISFGGTDSQISNCYASFNKEDGFRLYGGLNQMTNCKSYFNDGVGYFGNAYDYSLVNCDAQENGKEGFFLFDGNSIAMTNCHSEANGVKEKVAAFRFSGIQYLQLLGCKAMNSDVFKGKQVVGYAFENVSNVNISSQVISRNEKYETRNSTFEELYLIDEKSQNILGNINEICIAQ